MTVPQYAIKLVDIYLFTAVKFHLVILLSFTVARAASNLDKRRFMTKKEIEDSNYYMDFLIKLLKLFTYTFVGVYILLRGVLWYANYKLI